MLSIESGRYFGSRPRRHRHLAPRPGTDIDRADLRHLFMKRYDADAEACTADVTRFVENLVTAGTLRVVDPGLIGTPAIRRLGAQAAPRSSP